jgi:signal transduction histidine kinase
LSSWRQGVLSKTLPETGLTGLAVRAAAGDTQGHCWFVAGDHVFALDSERFTADARGLFEGNRGIGLHRARSGMVWSFGEGLLIPMGGIGSNYLQSAQAAMGQVLAVEQSADGGLWVGTRAGELWRRRAGEWLTIPTSSQAGQHPVRCLFEDREGNLWAGTDGGGLLRVKPRRLAVLGAQNGLVNEYILSIAGDGGDGVWLGANCGGITYWRGGACHPWTAQGALKTNACVGPLLRTRDGALWIGTAGEGLFQWKEGQTRRFGRAEGLPDPTILSLFQDREGRLWIGTDEAGLFQYQDGVCWNFTAKDGFPARIITAIVQDGDGDLWIGSNGMGLYRYANGRFSFYSRREGWGSDFIRTLLVDGEGALWIGSGGSGLTRMKDGWFHTLTTRHGLGDDVVSQILEDDFGHLWIGSNRGIFRMSKRAFADFAAGRSPRMDVIAYAKSEGMESLECTGGFQSAGWKAPNGALWFSTVKGAVKIDPAMLVDGGATNSTRPNRPFNMVPPPLVIEEVWVDDVRVVDASTSAHQGLTVANPASAITRRPTARLTVRPGFKRLEFRYTALSFTAPEKVRFRYRLADLDPAWTEAGDSRVARYTQLPPGDYVFHVTACNNDGVWNELGTTLGFTLRPHFWQTRWFFGGVILSAAALVAAVIRLRERRELRREVEHLERQHAVEQERRRIAQDMHDELGSRLAKLSFMSELARSSVHRPDEASQRIDAIATTSRSALETLDEIVWAVNPQNDTLEQLAAYVGEYARQFFQMTTIECQVQLPMSLPPFPLTAETRHHLFLAVQEALSNTLKHSHAPRVLVAMSLHAAAFEMVVEDDGCGFEIAHPAGSPPSGRNGLTNMRDRLASIGAHFQLQSRSGHGTRVTFHLPLAMPDGSSPMNGVRKQPMPTTPLTGQMEPHGR